MASVTINIPDSLVPRLIAAMNWRFPETEGQNPAAEFKRITGQAWRGILVDYEVGQAEVSVAAQVAALVNSARETAYADGSEIL